MLVRLLEARSFRNLDHAEAELADGITLIHGPNGAGKTNLLEALCFALTASSWRTRADRELIGFGAPLARAELTVIDGAETRRFLASATRADGRSHRLNGNPVPDDVTALRPAVAIFSPDRLALIKGPPTERRRLPLMLLDDVMSELDPERRLLLVELLRGEGQAVITATEASQVPDDAERAEIEINDGRMTLPIGARARAA